MRADVCVLEANVCKYVRTNVRIYAGMHVLCNDVGMYHTCFFVF